MLTMTFWHCLVWWCCRLREKVPGARNQLNYFSPVCHRPFFGWYRLISEQCSRALSPKFRPTFNQWSSHSYLQHDMTFMIQGQQWHKILSKSAKYSALSLYVCVCARYMWDKLDLDKNCTLKWKCFSVILYVKMSILAVNCSESGLKLADLSGGKGHYVCCVVMVKKYGRPQIT